MPYGDWVELFVRSGFAIERLVETRPSPRQVSAYLSATDNAWARSWPMECIWRLRRRGPEPPGRDSLRP
jgi:hypothetical protein